MTEEDLNISINDCDGLLNLVYERIGYEFKNYDLMLEAITHKSYFNENKTKVGHNERLEFLGDAVLDLIISEHLMKMLHHWSEGTLTKFRASLVNEDTLAMIAVDLNIDSLILLGKGELKNKGRQKESILADAVEALVGAVFLDSDFEKSKEVVLCWMESLIIDVISGKGLDDSKSILQQIFQEKGGNVSYKLLAEKGPDHERLYEVEVSYNGEILGIGLGRSKKEAQKEAAKKGLEKLGRKKEEECGLEKI